jgi:hypothetical protein
LHPGFGHHDPVGWLRGHDDFVVTGFDEKTKKIIKINTLTNQCNPQRERTSIHPSMQRKIPLILAVNPTTHAAGGDAATQVNEVIQR